MPPFRPLPNVAWNLFLAVVPVALSFFIAHGLRAQMRQRGRVHWLRWLPLLLLWLAFLPNTCYLLTEWRHYLDTVTHNPVYQQAQQDRENIVPVLLLTAFYVLYSGTGLLLLFLAVWPLDRLARRRLGHGIWPAQGLLFALCSLGVYLGLVNRYNSWQIARPSHLQAIVHSALSAAHSTVLLALIMGFGVILWTLYTLFDIGMDGAAWRLNARRERRVAALAAASQPEEREERHAAP